MQDNNKTNKLISFDIFDTTLIRKCGNPNNIFYILSKTLFPNNSALQNDFYNWRINVEKEYSIINPHVEANIYSLYDLLPTHIKKIYESKEIAKMEMKIESENLVANFEIKRMISHYRIKGYTICFISDMYLDSNFLKTVLMNQGCALSSDVVFVSNEYNRRKSVFGELFSIVRNYFPMTTEWIHYGDNYYSDLIYAKKWGVKARLVETSFNRSETYVLNKYIGCPFYKELSVLVGFQKCCRYTIGNTSDVSNASDLISSLYIPYIHFISSHARKLNIQVIYFLSRDANILYEMAKCYFDVQNNIEIRYLYVSRRALIQSCYEELSKGEILNLLGRKTLVGEKLESVLSLLQISNDLLGINFEQFRNEDDENIFFKAVEKNRRLILRDAEVKRQNVVDYLRQEGFLNCVSNMGVVDIGWVGTTRLMLNKLKNKYGKHSSVTFFYLGCVTRSIYCDKGDYLSFLPMSVDEIPVSYITELIENYYSAAPHTSTITYYSEGNCISPILENNANENVEALSHTNIDVCKSIIKYIKECPCLDFENAYMVWGLSFLVLFSKSPRMFDIDTFEKVYYYDKKFIKKVPLLNLVRYLLIGNTGLNSIDELSVYCTYGLRIKRKYTLYCVNLIWHKIIGKWFIK